MCNASLKLNLLGPLFSIALKDRSSLPHRQNDKLAVSILVLFAICFCTLQVQAKYGWGTGEPNDPYLIYDANQMNAIGANPFDWDKCFKLMADIDLSGYRGPGPWPPLLFARNPNPADGAKGVSRTADLSWTAGADVTSHNVYFGTTSPPPFACNQTATTFDPGTMADSTTYYWRIDEINKKGETTTGMVWSFRTIGAGPSLPSPTPPMTVDVDLSIYTGATFNIIGREQFPFTGVFDGNGHAISNFTCTSTATSHIGLFGYVTGEIKNLGLIAHDVDAGTGNLIGSLVGWLREGTITACYAEGGSVSGNDDVGGLVGYSEDGTITNCYAISSVSGHRYVGGLVGYNDSIITNCYSTGSVTGSDYVGGIVGYNEYGEITASFWDVETSGLMSSAGGTGKTTAEMQTARTFVCQWGYEPIWIIDEGNDYPRLLWENKPGEPITIPSYGGGNGEPNDPYLIYTAEQLNKIGLVPCHLDNHFKLMADIDLSSYTQYSFNVIGYYDYVAWEGHPFMGVFEGNGHTISNFTYDFNGVNYIGLFGYVAGEIKDLGLIDPDVDSGTGNYVGSLVGRLQGGTVTNCYVEGGNISGYLYVGKLVGYNDYGALTNCYSTGSVTGNNYVGGLVGYNYDTIVDCYSSGDVSGDYQVGGLVGYNWGTITDSYSSASVTGNSRVGGMVGLNSDGTISNCYATGDILGSENTGGLVGLNGEVYCDWYGCQWYLGKITNCFSTGSVEGDYAVGGLVGKNEYGTVFNSFWDIETSGQTTSAGGIGKTTAEMQDPNTYIGWGCDPVWTIDGGKDYARLWWEGEPGEALDTLLDGLITGTGEPNDPYLICTADELNMIGLFPCEWDKHFKLIADIDLSGFVGTSFNIIGIVYDDPFTGVFDGSGQTISNFTYDSNGTNYIGLFGYVNDPNAEIRNLGLIDPNIDAGTGSGVGSLVGWLREGTITNCYVEGGGISGNDDVGGLVGEHGWYDWWDPYPWWGYTISNCYSTASVAGTQRVGGLVGWNSSTITNSYSTGSVLGNDDVGGLVGENGWYECGWYWCSGHAGSISNCYSTGSVSGNNDDVGGLVGDNVYGDVTDSFWDTETSGQTSSDGGTGLPTAEMQMISTFTDAGWDFVGETFNGIEDIWFTYDGIIYPRLWYEYFPLLSAEVKIIPHTINLATKDKWMTCYIWLPEDYDVTDIDCDSVRLQGVIAPDMLQVDEEQQVALVRFDRSKLQDILSIGQVEMKITGRLTDWTIFEGTDTIKINDNNSEHEPKDPNSKNEPKDPNSEHEKKDHSLIAHWKFDDNSDSTAIDSAGKNDGILIGNPTWTTGIIDGALSFNGDGDYVAVDSVSALAGDAFTIKAWICVDSSAGIWNPVLVQHDLNNDGCYFYVASSKPSFYIVGGSNSVQVISPEKIHANQWYPVAVTNDGSTLNLYVNGLLKATNSSVGLTGVDYNAYIACEISYPLYYNGLIDDVRIYDRALGQDEIAILAD